MRAGERPPYPITSVDNALQLALRLREGSLAVSEAADELGVARSTAHRLLAMLVYHGFARQGPDRRYAAGPVLGTTGGAPAALEHLAWVARPHLRTLAARVGETVNLMVLTGTVVRFLDSLESRQVLHIGSRAGVVLPAERTSGGKALLAALDDAEVARRYGAEPERIDLDRLLADLAVVRSRGYGLNTEETERGVRAVGMAVHSIKGAAAALAVAAPAQRLRAPQLKWVVTALQATVAAVEKDLGRWSVTSGEGPADRFDPAH